MRKTGQLAKQGASAYWQQGEPGGTPGAAPLLEQQSWRKAAVAGRVRGGDRRWREWARERWQIAGSSRYHLSLHTFRSSSLARDGPGRRHPRAVVHRQGACSSTRGGAVLPPQIFQPRHVDATPGCLCRSITKTRPRPSPPCLTTTAPSPTAPAAPADRPARPQLTRAPR